jgi:hypothetical protein
MMADKEIRCDSATLHIYTDIERHGALTDDPQLGERQFFGERDTLMFPSLSDRSMRLYAVLWKDNQPMTCTYPDWVHPGGVYEVDRTMTVHVEGNFPGEEFYDYYSAPVVFCKWPGCGWQETVSWGEQEKAFKMHFVVEHMGARQ